jgi:hypothetical protein
MNMRQLRLNAETLRFAGGQNSNMSPHHIFGISITGEQDHRRRFCQCLRLERALQSGPLETT